MAEGRLAADDDLYAGLESEQERESRRELLDWLDGAGVGKDRVRDAIAEDRLALLPVETILSGDERYTLTAAAREAKLDTRFLREVFQALGLPQPRHGERAFGEQDIEAARALKRFRDEGLPREGLLEVARVMGQGTASITAAVLRLAGEALIQPGDTERDLGLRYARAIEEMGPLLGPLLVHVLRMHMRQGLRGAIVGSAERAEGRLGSQEVTVAFADLVGFTRMGEERPADELGAVAVRLAQLASAQTSREVELVKTIGDAAMLVSRNNTALIDAVAGILHGANSEGEDFPQVRAGLARGEALTRGGDWYGPPVNLASRVTGIAKPGTVLATEEVVEAATDGYDWKRTRRRRLKGVDGRRKLFRLATPDSDGSND
jgi:adenylate cyclase